MDGQLCARQVGEKEVTPEQRVNELRKRQVWYGSSMVIRLNSIDGKYWYSIYAWTADNTKFLVTMDKYNGQDPDEMIQVALLELGCKKIKLGVPQ